MAAGCIQHCAAREFMRPHFGKMGDTFGFWGEREQILADQPANRGFTPGGAEVTAIRLFHLVDGSSGVGKDRLENRPALPLGQAVSGNQLME